MKKALVATIDSFPESIVGFSKDQKPTVAAQSAVAAATKNCIFMTAQPGARRLGVFREI
jgi:hypothetical protein